MTPERRSSEPVVKEPVVETPRVAAGSVTAGDFFKTVPYAHQLEGWERSRAEKNFALFWEMRCGKTKVILDTAAWLYDRWTLGDDGVDAVLVIAPSGVHRNWVTDEAPAHLPDWTHPLTLAWSSGRATSRSYQERLESLLTHRGLVLLAANVEAVLTENLRKFLRRYVTKRRVLFVHDEAADAADSGSKRSKLIYAIAQACPYRRVLDGTPVAESPLDLYGQLRVLTRAPLGFSSQTAFDRQFANWETKVNWKVKCYRCSGAKSYRNATGPVCDECYGNRVAPGGVGECGTCQGVGRLCEVCGGDGRGRYRTIARDPVTEEKEYINLEQLQQLILPFSSRVRRADCADLPEATYAKRYFELSPAQASAYAALRDRFRLELGDTAIVSAADVLKRTTRLQQVTSGYLPTDVEATTCGACDGLGLEGEDPCPRCGGDGLVVPSGEVVAFDPNPRLEALLHEVTQLGRERQFIVWARFRHDVATVALALNGLGVSTSVYQGGMSDAAKDAAKLAFRAGFSRALVANPAAAGRGLTLPCSTVFYYSNSYSLRQRLQSEDRAVTLATREPVFYVDLVAAGTVDEAIVRALRGKLELSSYLLRDGRREWL